MKIIADENMPNVEPLFSSLGEITLVDGRALCKAQLKDADILLVRSVTKVTQALLEDTPVKYVGSATIGTDHVDMEYLAEAGIGFNSAPGCNADAVADYVFSALVHLYMTKGVRWLDHPIGIVGQGNVGKSVASRFVKLGCEVLAYDPFLERSISGVTLTSLEQVLNCEVVCLHAPLTKTGEYPTFNMIDAAHVANLRAGQSIISAGRGGVINEAALMLRHRELEGKLNLVLDVWDNEPLPNLDLADICDIATPHIAGYSKQGREKGTWYIYQSLCQYFDLPIESSFADAMSKGCVTDVKLNSSLDRYEAIARAIQSIYDVARDSARFKHVMKGQDKGFDWLRKNYIERDEFNTCSVYHPKFLKELRCVGFAQE